MMEKAAIDREVEIDAPPELVFSFLTDAEKMVQWMGSEVELDPRPGGIYRVFVREGTIARGTVLEVDPPNTFRFSFGWEGSPGGLAPGASTVEITLVPSGQGTRVRLRHFGLPDGAEGEHDEGWAHYLGRLQVRAAGGNPGEDTWEEEEEA
jgi:uncharacterized protein YndB with AHSA1/START domain